MARVKRGVASHKRHKRLLERAKGYRMTRNRLVKVASEAVLHAGEYAYVGRKRRKRQFRRLWIVRLNAALSEMDLKYSTFMNLLKKQKVLLDRKILCYLASEKPTVFAALVKEIQK